jgi:hypothetical protein
MKLSIQAHIQNLIRQARSLYDFNFDIKLQGSFTISHDTKMAHLVEHCTII